MIRKRITWTDESAEIFKEELRAKDPSKGWGELKCKVSMALSWKETKIEEDYKRMEKFWDEECHRKRKN